MTIVDASALLAIIAEEDGARAAVPLSQGGMISAVNIAEVVGKLLDRGYDPEGVKVALDRLGMTVEPFTAEQGRLAGQLRPLTRAHKLSLADRACVALALDKGGRIVTADRIWADLDIGVEIVLIR